MERRVYYIELAKALDEVNQQIAEIKIKNPNEYDEGVNYPKLLNELYQIQRKINRMQVVHKYLRMSQETFIAGDITSDAKEIYHTVSSFETLHSIAKKYNISIELILKNNNISSQNLTAGSALKIVQAEANLLEAGKIDIPVYTESGDLIEVLGRDLKNSLEIGDFGDILALTPRNTISQGLINRLTTLAGDYPNEDDFGLDYFSDLKTNPELINNLWKVKIMSQLETDPRIKNVKSLEIEDGEEGSKNIRLVVETITGEEVAV